MGRWSKPVVDLVSLFYINLVTAFKTSDFYEIDVVKR